MAWPPDWPGYQASSRARAFCWAQLTARALPLSRTTTIGLPVLATASSICCWTSGRSMSVRSPPEKPLAFTFISSPSRRGVSPTKAITTSAFLAAATAWS